MQNRLIERITLFIESDDMLIEKRRLRMEAIVPCGAHSCNHIAAIGGSALPPADCWVAPHLESRR